MTTYIRAVGKPKVPWEVKFHRRMVHPLHLSCLSLRARLDGIAARNTWSSEGLTN
ncbi:hypothetical protein B0I35DRAFT_416129 [Stachybotrys elegans]|uniref:Uncharacterized protein n=1 Tax=Stachybotrys elegans TaxID=80388 RepID=A0A8K0WWZ6_9HYPO|nr:hypothetical protein B0I35DRAFT_416129 [Stachybotrys elegans]